MAWTYNSDPSSSPKDLIRFRIGDTDSNDPLLSDEEILFLIDQTENVNSATSKAFDSVLTKLAREVDYTIGPEQVKASQKYQNYLQLATRFKGDLVSVVAAPIWGQPSTAPSRPIFNIGMHDYVKDEVDLNG